jgi:hypothetical protein
MLLMKYKIFCETQTFASLTQFFADFLPNHSQKCWVKLNLLTFLQLRLFQTDGKNVSAVTKRPSLQEELVNVLQNSGSRPIKLFLGINYYNIVTLL